MAETDEIDVEALQRMNVEYAAALRALLGEDFDDVLNEHVVTRRDGTVVFVPPETATNGDSDTPNEEESSEGDDSANDSKKAETKRPPISKLPAQLTAAGGKQDTKDVSLRDMITMKPSDFEAAYDKWVADNSTEEMV